jgi:hypothetical protein
VKKLSKIGAILFLSLAACTGVAAQDTTTTNAGNNDASISTSTTRRQPQPRQTPTTVTPVRPLSAEDQRRQQEASDRRRREASTGDPDVLLDIPNLSVEEINLEVENLRARVSLDARLANLRQGEVDD